MANIKDIARLSGYSVATVSRYINKNGYVSEKAAKAIQRVVESADYVPNTIARDLSTGQTKTIGVVVPFLEYSYFSQLFASIAKAAFNAGYSVIALKSNYDSKLERQYLEQLHQKKYDGLIFTSHTLSLKTMLLYKKYGPIVCCRNLGDVPIASTYAVRNKTYLEVFDLVKKENFQRVAMTLNRDYGYSPTTRATIDCYEQVFHQKPKPEYIVTGSLGFTDGYHAAEHYLSLPEPPDFIFTNGDNIAAGIYQCYRDHDQPVPAMIGQEDEVASRLMNISTIDHHYEEVGENAVNLVISKRIAHMPVASELILRTGQTI